MFKLIWLSYAAVSLAWYGASLGIVWTYPLVHGRYATAARGHALAWPPEAHGAPTVARVGAMVALAIAGLQMFVEPALWPPLFGAGLGTPIALLGAVEGYFLEQSAYDVLHRAPNAALRWTCACAVSAASRVGLAIALRWANTPPVGELSFPLPLAV
jgi:hypothetical protein